MPGDPGRRGRHRRGGAARQEVRHVHPARWCGSASRSTSPATRAWRTTATSCARSPTRSCTRSCGSPARSTSTCTPPGPRRSPSGSSARRRRPAGRAPSPTADAEEGVLTPAAALWSPAGPGGRGPAVPGAGGPAGRRPRQRGRAQPLPRRQLRPPASPGSSCVAADGRLDGLRRSGRTPTRPGARPLAAGRRPRGRASRLILVSPLVKGDGLQRDDPRLLGDGRRCSRGRSTGTGGAAWSPASCSGRGRPRRCATSVTQANYGNVFLLLIGGPIVGFLCESLQRMARERDARAAARPSAAEERARLARAVHDGVLQVLALVQRRGRRARAATDSPSSAGWPGSRRRALRSLIRQQDPCGRPPAATDLAAAAGARLTRAGRCRSRCRRRASRCELPGAGGRRAGRRGRAPASTTSPRHVGAGRAGLGAARGRPPTEVDGVGARRGPGHPGRPARARPRPRAGSASRSRSAGRIADLGGTATLDTGAYGTEWELVVPRRRTRRPRDHPLRHPFADPEPDPVRRLRGRLGGAVTLWTAGDGATRAGLTVTSLMVAGGEPGPGAGAARPRRRPARPRSRATGRARRAAAVVASTAQLAEAFAGHGARARAGRSARRTFEQTAVRARGCVDADDVGRRSSLEDVRDVGLVARWSTCTARRGRRRRRRRAAACTGVAAGSARRRS